MIKLYEQAPKIVGTGQSFLNFGVFIELHRKENWKNVTEKSLFLYWKVLEEWWYSSYENPAIFYILSNISPLIFKMRTPEETNFQYYTIETLTGVRFLGFF